MKQPFVRAAERNARVTFYRKVRTQNSSGEDVVTLTELGSAWIQILPLRGRREKKKGQQTAAEAQFEIRMEHPLSSYTLRSQDVAVWGTRTLDLIVPEDLDQRRRQIGIYAEEFVP